MNFPNSTIHPEDATAAQLWAATPSDEQSQIADEFPDRCNTELAELFLVEPRHGETHEAFQLRVGADFLKLAMAFRDRKVKGKSHV